MSSQDIALSIIHATAGNPARYKEAASIIDAHHAALVAERDALLVEAADAKDDALRLHRDKMGLFDQNIVMRIALQGVIDAWVNPGDGQPFESGEVPALDAARAALSPDASQREEG